MCEAKSMCHSIGVCDFLTGECSDPEKSADTPCGLTTAGRCDGAGNCGKTCVQTISIKIIPLP